MRDDTLSTATPHSSETQCQYNMARTVVVTHDDKGEHNFFTNRCNFYTYSYVICSIILIGMRSRHTTGLKPSSNRSFSTKQ